MRSPQLSTTSVQNLASCSSRNVINRNIRTCFHSLSALYHQNVQMFSVTLLLIYRIMLNFFCDKWLQSIFFAKKNCDNIQGTTARELQINNSIDLFSLYILFSHFRPRDATRGSSFFQMSSYAHANLRITNEKTKGKFP